MTKIKTYTDISQSKKLAEILPLESADMDYIPVINTDNIDGEYSVIVNNWDNDHIIEEGWIPCWSLSALLGVIPLAVLDKYYNSEIKAIQWICTAFPENYRGLETNNYDNPVDTCVSMILKLHELNLL